ncbi:hypothetical protein HWV62_4053 [Athelia sp. TMB]|nr:hypothetical protein HWV62_4053 [Athelia sp. TMB]
MDIRSMLAANNSKLLEVYHENHTATVELQQTLLEDVFPHVMNELELGIESEAACWARRHKFTRSFAMESIRQNLVWRIQTIHPRAEAPPLGMLHCLPSDITDPFKRPIIVLKVSDLAAENGKEDLKDLLMPTIDRLQAHLKELNKYAESGSPLLQYVILLDLADVSMQSMIFQPDFIRKDINLITWAMREVIPRFPGMIAAGNLQVSSSAQGIG